MTDAPVLANQTASPRRIRELRAQAHHLRPVVMVADHGASGAVIAETERALASHGLIKIHVAAVGKTERSRILDTLCKACGAIPVQSIGRMIVLYRQPVEKPQPAATPIAKNRGNAAKRTTRKTRRRPVRRT